MTIQRLTPEQVFESLKSSPAGLSWEEVRRRASQFGPNRVEELPRESIALRSFRQLTHFLALVLWVAAGLAFFSEARQPGQGMGTLGVAIVGVILVNAAFSFVQEYRAETALAALRQLLPRQAKAMRAGTLAALPVSDLVPGDLVLLEEGDRVPADCRIVEAFRVRVDNATITGESFAVERVAEPCDESDATDATSGRNILLAGTWLAAGRAQALVYATGMRTEVGKIARLTQSVESGPSPLQREVTHLSRILAILATSLGVVFFLAGGGFGSGVWRNVLFGIGILVANVPEGLLPTVTLSLAVASQRMARRNALVKHLPAVETLGSTTVIVTDKTGTLTQNRMEARRVFHAGVTEELSSLAAPAAGALGNLLEGALSCHDVKETGARGEELLGDPTEVALVQMGRRLLPGRSAGRRLHEIPFDSGRRRLSTLHETARGRVLFTKGAFEAVLPLCDSVEGLGRVEPLTPERREEILRAQDAMAGDGLRVLAFAFRLVPEGEDLERLEERLTLSGLVGLADPPRPEVPEAIARCRDARIRVVMATGDHPGTAKAIARQIGLVTGPSPRVVTGAELRALSSAELKIALDAPEILFARVTAEQKLEIVTALKEKREVVAVTGDGVNDAPALRKADIGIAMGIAGTDVAREAAHMVLLDDNFATIVNAVEEGRAVFENIRKFLTYILTSNVAELVPYLAFFLFRLPLALTIVQILAVDLGTDMLPALALGAERPIPGVMKRPPRPRNVRLLTPGLLARAYLFLGVLEAVAAMAAFFFVLSRGGWRLGVELPPTALLYRQATSACLAAIILAQVVNVFLCRSERDSILALPFLGNPSIFWGIGAELALLAVIVVTPVGNHLFGTAPVPAAALLFAAPFALAMLLLEEGRKRLVRGLWVNRIRESANQHPRLSEGGAS